MLNFEGMKKRIVVILFAVLVVGVLLASSNFFASHETPTVVTTNSISSSVSLPQIPQNYAVDEINQNEISLVKNENNFFPFTTNNINGLVVSVGANPHSFVSMMSNMTTTQIVTKTNLQEVKSFLSDKPNINQLLLTLHLSDNEPAAIETLETELRNLLEVLPKAMSKGIVVFGSPYVLRSEEIINLFDGVVISYVNRPFIQNRTAQKICGALPMKGKFKWNINAVLKENVGLELSALNRLAFVSPEEVGISSEKLKEIDDLLLQAIKDGVFPGCQVAFSYKGKVVYNKSFGNYTYDENDGKIHNNVLYDLASLTKVLSSTPALMRLQTEDKFSLNKRLLDYLPDLVKGTVVQNMTLKSIMAHQAGFAPFIPFYKRTMVNGELDSTIYSPIRTDYFNLPVAKNMWINEHYRDTMMNEILHKKLVSPGKYKYSDIGYYFVQRIVEKVGGKSLDIFMKDEIYRKMGLNRIGYQPLSFYPSVLIAPTEDDQLFRKQLVRGYVHDPGAAMQGGVAGHAGLFANATDVLAMLQLFLNKGEYAGQQLIDKNVVEEYVKQQFNGNRRAAGFDRPTSNRDAMTWPISDLASDNSYGHSGFTGTFVWIDPEKEIGFVFLCNRVYPDAENWKISKQRIRIKAHRLVYQLLPN